MNPALQAGLDNLLGLGPEKLHPAKYLPRQPAGQAGVRPMLLDWWGKKRCVLGTRVSERVFIALRSTVGIGQEWERRVHKAHIVHQHYHDIRSLFGRWQFLAGRHCGSSPTSHAADYQPN